MTTQYWLAIVGIDPGGTTGWAAILTRTDKWEMQTWDSGEIAGTEREQLPKLAQLLQPNGGLADCWEFDNFETVLVVEDFILRQSRQDRDLLAPVRVTARLEQWNDWEWEYPLFKQQPALAKSAVPNANLKHHNLYVRGQPHANDAMRHARTFLLRLKQDGKVYGKLCEQLEREING